jgi:hypothetical protein
MTSREKQLAAMVGLLTALLLPTATQNLMQAYSTLQALGGFTRVWQLYTSAEAKLAKTPQEQITRSTALRQGDESEPAYQVQVYGAVNQTYLLKPDMKCGPGGALNLLRIDGGNWNLRYRDVGDRWVFEINGPPGAMAYVEPVCSFGGHAAKPIGSNPPAIRPSPADREV